MRETTLLHAVVSGIFCGLLFWVGVLWTHGSSSHGWDAFALLPVAAVLSSPLALLAWSIIATARWRSRTLSWTRHFIRCHGALAVFVLLLGCSDHLDLPGFYRTTQENVGVAGFAAALVDLVLLGLIVKPASDAEMLRLYRKTVLIIAGSALLGVALWPVAIIGLVATQAEIIAGSRPYCIQVASEFSGEFSHDAVSLSDLNGLTMHAGDDPFAAPFDAALIVQTDDDKLEWWSWSYFYERFEWVPDETVKLFRPRPYCTPKARFVRLLPIRRPAREANGKNLANPDGSVSPRPGKPVGFDPLPDASSGDAFIIRNFDKIKEALDGKPGSGKP